MARKRYKITPQGYITIGAAVILLIALIILLSVTNCFGACSGKEGAVDLPSPTSFSLVSCAGSSRRQALMGP